MAELKSFGRIHAQSDKIAQSNTLVLTYWDV